MVAVCVCVCARCNYLFPLLSKFLLLKQPLFFTAMYTHRYYIHIVGLMICFENVGGLSFLCAKQNQPNISFYLCILYIRQWKCFANNPFSIRWQLFLLFWQDGKWWDGSFSVLESSRNVSLLLLFSNNNWKIEMIETIEMYMVECCI